MDKQKRIENNRVKYLIIIATTLLLLQLNGTAQTKKVKRSNKPNIIFILTDDMGFGDISCFNGVYKTPNIDKIAKEGRRFTNYYSVSPICSPSRAGFLTGMAPARFNFTTYLDNRKHNKNCEQADFLPVDAPSVARVLHDAGYATGHFGKWRMGGGRDVHTAPSIKKYGFDEYNSTWESPDPDPLITDSNWIWSSTDSIKRWNRTAYFVDKTLQFLKNHKGQPCYIDLWPDDVHTPWVPGDGEVRAYPGGPQEEVSFLAVLKEYDKQMGRLLDGIKELGIDENTIIVFTSDNGPLPNFRHDRSAYMRGSKLSLYDGGTKMPFFIRWPSHIAANTIDSTSVVCSNDLFLSFSKLAGANVPKDYKSDGEEKSAVLLGNPAQRKKDIFWEYGRNNFSFNYPRDVNDKSPALAIREDKWKLLMNPDGSKIELYNMLKDRTEKNNLASTQKKLVGELSANLLKWWNNLPKLK